jgi:hypothetical protein
MTVSKPLGGLRQPQRVINLPDLVQGWAFLTDRWIWMIQLDVIATQLLLSALAVRSIYQLNLTGGTSALCWICCDLAQPSLMA